MSANPFIDLLDARGYILAGDAWARIALECADRARECWAEASAILDDAARDARALESEATREGNEDAEVWRSIARNVDWDREVSP